MQVATSASACAVARLLLILLLPSPSAVALLTPITNGNINSAVSDWTTSPTAATTRYGDVGAWNTALVINMGDLFSNKPTFNQNIGSWNVASVSNMNSMFYKATTFNQDISAWNVASVSNMQSIFSFAYSFAQDISVWNVARTAALAGATPSFAAPRCTFVTNKDTAFAVARCVSSTIGCVAAGAFDSAHSLDECSLWKIYTAWGVPMERVYKRLAESAWRLVCESTTCDPDVQWKDPQTAVCRRKALLAVLASTEEVTVLELALLKSEEVRSVSQSIELRLKDGDIAADPDRIIHWTVVGGSAAPWLSFAPVDGSLYSSESVAAAKATAVGAGLGDTAMTGPFNANITFKSSARLMKPSDFVNGTDQLAITVRLSVFAKPYVNETHVTITRSSEAPVGPAEPIEAGEKLTVSVKAFDFEGLSISRPDLQLRLEIWGNLNKNHSIPLQLKADGTNVYMASIPET